jgi:signal peptidase I
MKPTLLVGDFIFVSKFSYGFSRYSLFFQPKFIKGHLKIAEPKRGDVAVFFHRFYEGEDPSFYDHGNSGFSFAKLIKTIQDILQVPSEGVNYVKRVIGLPGDRIQMKEGKLFINGEEVPLTYVDEYIEDEKHLRVAKRYIEKLPGGVEHYILKLMDFGAGHLDDTEEFVVPEGHCFMMGDNRDNSCDSREPEKVGMIPHVMFIGKPQFIFFSTTAKWYEVHHWLFARYGRFFQRIR